MPFIAENDLERALVKAVTDAAAAPDFYRLLLESDLLVMGSVEGREDATSEFALEPGGKIHLVTGMHNGKSFLPIFSSLTRMQDYINQECKYLRIRGRALFDLTRGAQIFLNPASECGKELTPEQVMQLLDPHSLRGQPRMVTGETEYPVALVEALTAAFRKRPDIEAAWMIHVGFADRPEPHPLVGIETTGDWKTLVEAVEKATSQLAAGMVFDIQRIDRQSPTSLTDALLRTQPFYQRGRGPALN